MCRSRRLRRAILLPGRRLHCYAAKLQGAESTSRGEIDPQRFISRVMKAFHSAAERETEVRMRLHPAELGSLSIEVR